jgi:acetylornithine deacetylase/succinyl-diaminopimelate desuccinylase-like protein
LKKIHNHIDRHFAHHLAQIQEHVRQSSISADDTGMKETAEMTRSFIEKLDGNSRPIKTDGWSVVYGEVNADAKKTLVIYGMYDVQQVKEESGMWVAPPFNGKVVNFKPFGKCLVNRGATNSKAPLRVFFNAANQFLKWQ